MREFEVEQTLMSYAYDCMYIYIYMCILHIYIYIYTCMYVCMDGWMDGMGWDGMGWMDGWIDVYIYIHMCARVSVRDTNIHDHSAIDFDKVTKPKDEQT